MLRVKDLDLERGELAVRRGKGGKDRVTVIPETVRGPLREHLGRVKELHDRDVSEGVDGWRYREVWIPSTQRRDHPGRGSGYFRRGGGTGMRRVAMSGGTTSMSRSCSEP